MAIKIEFGEKTRTLKYDLAAIRDLEAVLEKPLATIIGDLTRLGVNAMVVALWAGLKHEDKTLNPNLVTKMLEKYIRAGGKRSALTRAIDAAMTETGLFSNEDDDEGNEQPEPAPAT